MRRIRLLVFSVISVVLASCENDTTERVTADFEYSTDHALVGENITFKAVTTGSPSKWTWHFEGAEVEQSILTQPVVRWMDAGTYSVSLKVSNKDSEDEVTKEKIITIDYHSTVKADFVFDKTQLFDNEYISFTNLSSGYPSNIKWIFTSSDGEQVISNDENPSLMFSPGVYSIRLEISNPVASDVKEVENAFTVLDRYAVIADFSAVNHTTYEGGIITFKNTSSGNVANVEWSFEGGEPSISSEMNPEVKYSTPGSYEVRLRAYNEKYESVIEKTGFVNVVPSCDGDLVLLLPFDNDILDHGPNEINPTIYQKGDETVSFIADHGKGYGQSLKFPGGTKGKAYSVLLMPEEKLTKVYPQGSEMTVSAWLKTSAISKNAALFAQGHCPGFESSNQIWARFQSGHAFRVTAEKTGIGGNTLTVKNNKFDDDTWHHIAVVYDRISDEGTQKMKLSIYLDGELIGKPVINADKDTYTTPYCIGANLRWTDNAIAPENMFFGEIDDFILYKTALSEDQVKQLSSM